MKIIHPQTYSRFFLTGIIASIILAISGTSFSQMNEANAARSYISLEGGAAYSWFSHSENFFFLYVYPYDVQTGAKAKKMFFDKPGAGIGYRFGITGEFPLYQSNALRFGLHYDKLSTASTDTRINASPGVTQNSSLSSFETSYNSSWTFANADMLFRQSLFKSFYILIGGGFSYLVTDRLDATQKIINGDPNSQYLSLATGMANGRQELKVVDQTSTNYFDHYNGSLKFGIGTFIFLGGNFFISPEVILSFPLNHFFTSAAQDIYAEANSTVPHLWHADLTLALRYSISGSIRNEPEPPPPPPVAYLSAPRSLPKENSSLFIAGRVKDCHTALPVIADLVITDLDSNKTVLTMQTGIVGSFSIPISRQGKYSVTASARGYSFRSELFDLSDPASSKKVTHDILLCSEGENIRLLVFFDYDKAELTSSSYPELDRTARLIKETAGMKVEIAGYTDSHGSDEYNIELSRKRAESVRKYLLSKNIDSQRIVVKGYGKQNPVASNETEEGRAENRRVEFVILK